MSIREWDIPYEELRFIIFFNNNKYNIFNNTFIYEQLRFMIAYVSKSKIDLTITSPRLS